MLFPTDARHAVERESGREDRCRSRRSSSGTSSASGCERRSPRHLALSLAHRVETQLTAVTKVTEGIARSLETARHDEPHLLSLIRTTLEANPDVDAAGVAFEPHAFSPSNRLYAPFYYRELGALSLRRLETAYASVPYLHHDWYQIPRELGRTEWSEPYYDEGAGNRLLASCSVPFRTGSDADPAIAGMATCSISLDALTDLISSVKILRTGYAALLSRNAMILAHPLKDTIPGSCSVSICTN